MQELGFHAQEIYEMAVEKYLRDEHLIYQHDGRYYAPTDPMSGTPMMTEEVLRKTVWDTELKFNEIHSLFNDFLVLPDPADFDGPMQSVTTCMDALCSDAFTDPIQGTPHPVNVELRAMTVAGNTLDEWDGLAAKAFMDNFVIPFVDRTENQFTVASILMNALNANKELWTRARANIDDIAHKVKSALDHYDDCGKNEWEIGLSVAGAVVAIAAGPGHRRSQCRRPRRRRVGRRRGEHLRRPDRGPAHERLLRGVRGGCDRQGQAGHQRPQGRGRASRAEDRRRDVQQQRRRLRPRHRLPRPTADAGLRG